MASRGGKTGDPVKKEPQYGGGGENPYVGGAETHAPERGGGGRGGRGGRWDSPNQGQIPAALDPGLSNDADAWTNMGMETPAAAPGATPNPWNLPTPPPSAGRLPTDIGSWWRNRPRPDFRLPGPLAGGPITGQPVPEPVMGNDMRSWVQDLVRFDPGNPNLPTPADTPGLSGYLSQNRGARTWLVDWLNAKIRARTQRNNTGILE